MVRYETVKRSYLLADQFANGERCRGRGKRKVNLNDPSAKTNGPRSRGAARGRSKGRRGKSTNEIINLSGGGRKRQKTGWERTPLP